MNRPNVKYATWWVPKRKLLDFSQRAQGIIQPLVLSILWLPSNKIFEKKPKLRTRNWPFVKLQQIRVANGFDRSNQIKCDNKINQVFFILTTRELSVNRKDLWAPNLAGPPQLYQGSGPPNCTTPWQNQLSMIQKRLFRQKMTKQYSNSLISNILHSTWKKCYTKY